MHFDPDKYMEHLASMDVSPAQKRALIEALFHICVGLADRYFEQDAVSLAPLKNASGHCTNSLDKPPR